MDEAKVQLHLGAKEARDEIQLHVVKLEQEFNQAKEKWRELENVTESAGEDIHRGLKGSLKTMQKSFEKTQQHFQKEEKKYCPADIALYCFGSKRPSGGVKSSY